MSVDSIDAVRPTRTNAPRTLVLGTFGAVAGLAMAGFGLFTAKGTSTLIVPAEDVAMVNQQPISRIDFVAAMQANYETDLAHATTKQKRKLLNDMIREELLVQRGKELDMASVDPDVRTALINAVEQQAAINAYTDQPSEEKLRIFFESHRALYSSEGTMNVRDVFFRDSTSARAAAAALSTGKDLGVVTSMFNGHDSGKVSGDEFYFAAKLHLGDSLFDVARALPTGGVSDPTNADGIHVLVMLKNTPPVAESFEKVQPRVLEDYRRDAASGLQVANIDFLRKRSNILVADDLQ